MASSRVISDGHLMALESRTRVVRAELKNTCTVNVIHPNVISTKIQWLTSTPTSASTVGATTMGLPATSISHLVGVLVAAEPEALESFPLLFVCCLVGLGLHHFLLHRLHVPELQKDYPSSLWSPPSEYFGRYPSYDPGRRIF
nr:hypothetical protein Iba_chr09eCG5290 [Ipomoea batatas]